MSIPAAPILDVTARPWAPFVVGFAIGVGFDVWVLWDGSWRTRRSIGNPWEYDSELEKAWVNFKRTDWRWSVLFSIPLIVGIVVWVVWFLLSFIAGVGV